MIEMYNIEMLIWSQSFWIFFKKKLGAKRSWRHFQVVNPPQFTGSKNSSYQSRLDLATVHSPSYLLQPYLAFYPSSINNLKRAKITRYLLAAYDLQPCLPNSAFFSQPCSTSSMSSLPFFYRTSSYMPTTSEMSGNENIPLCSPLAVTSKRKHLWFLMSSLSAHSHFT